LKALFFSAFRKSRNELIINVLKEVHFVNNLTVFHAGKALKNSIFASLVK